MVAICSTELSEIVMSNITIIGCQPFVDRTREALEVLQQLDSFSYRRAEKYISEIREVSNGSCIDTKNRTFYVGVRTAFPEYMGIYQDAVKWYASSIAHDAVHSELDNRFDIDPFTSDERIRRMHEEISLRVQGRCMKRLGIMDDDGIKHFIEDALSSEYWNVDREHAYW